MSAGAYAAGTACFALIVGPTLLAAWLVVRRWFTYLRGAEALLAFGLLSTAGLLAIVVVTGALDVLARGTAVLAALLLLAAAAWTTRLQRGPGTRPDRRNESGWRRGRLVWTIGGTAALAVAVYAMAFLIDRRTAALPGTDILTFGLPMIARWIQQGQIWSAGHYDVYWSFGTYPNNGEAVQLLWLLPWHSDAFVRFSVAPYFALTGVGVYALGTRLGAPRPVGLAWAAAALAVPGGLLSALEDTKPDAFMLACFVGGLVFLARHVRSRDGRDLLLAGTGLGLAFGSRWYGITAVVVVVAVWFVARLIAGVPRRQLIRSTLVVVGLVAAGGGFWLLRNWIQVGDPVFPVRVPLLFYAPPDYIREHAGFTLLHYATDGHVWSTYLLPALRKGFAAPAAFGLVACLIGVFGLVRRRRGEDGLVPIAALTALLLGVVYAVTPYTAQGGEGKPVLAIVNTRYGLPAVMVAAAVAAALGGRGRRWALASASFALIATADALSHIDNATTASYIAHVARPKRVIEALVVLALLAGAAWLLVRGGRWVRVAVVGVIAVVLVAGGYKHQRFYIDHRYVGLDPAIDAALRSPGPHTIGVTGTSGFDTLPPFLPLGGPRLQNRVRPLARVTHHVAYPVAGKAELAAALRGERYDLIYVLKPRGGSAPEVQWAQQLGWHQVAAGDTSALLRR